MYKPNKIGFIFFKNKCYKLFTNRNNKSILLSRIYINYKEGEQMVEIIYISGKIEKIKKAVLKGFLIAHKNDILSYRYIKEVKI